MPRLSLTWPFIHNTTTNNNNNTSSRPSSSSTPLRRKPRTKSRSATGKAPLVSPRESSLYRSAGRRAESPSGRVSDHTATPLHRDAHAHAQPHSSYSSLYHLQDNPSLFFPAPPPRLHLTFDTARHSVVWDDLFDWAESYDLEEDDSPLNGYCRFGYTSQVDLRATSDKRRSVRFAGSSSLGLQGLGASGAKSEIWTKVSLTRERGSVVCCVWGRAPVSPSLAGWFRYETLARCHRSVNAVNLLLPIATLSPSSPSSS